MPHRPPCPRQSEPHSRASAEEDESPDQLEHLAVVPIVRLDLASLRALAYAASLGQPLLAVHISPGDDEAARFKGYWAAWGDHVPLEVVDSPYRAVVAPLACYIDALRRQRDLTLTVVLPAIIVKHRWQQLFTTAPLAGCDAHWPPTGGGHHHHPPSSTNLTELSSRRFKTV